MPDTLHAFRKTPPLRAAFYHNGRQTLLSWSFCVQVETQHSQSAAANSGPLHCVVKQIIAAIVQRHQTISLPKLNRAGAVRLKSPDGIKLDLLPMNCQVFASGSIITVLFVMPSEAIADHRQIQIVIAPVNVAKCSAWLLRCIVFLTWKRAIVRPLKQTKKRIYTRVEFCWDAAESSYFFTPPKRPTSLCKLQDAHNNGPPHRSWNRADRCFNHIK